MIKFLKIDEFAIYILWIAAVFDPVGSIFGFRYLALICIVSVFLFKILRSNFSFSIQQPYGLLFFFFVFFLPLYGSLIALVRGGIGGASFNDTSYFASAVIFACSLIYFFNKNIEIALRAQIFSLRCLSLIIIFCLITAAGGFSMDWIYFFVLNGVAFFSQRNYGGFDFYYIYFIASPMLIFLLAHESWTFFERPSIRGFFLLMLPIIALFLSGTRANILVSIGAIPLIYLWRRFGLLSVLPFIFLIVMFAIVVIAFDSSIAASMFGSDDVSNLEKLNYLSLYSEIFSNPINLLFGQGLNAKEWSTIVYKMVGTEASKTELTYLELLRVFGLFGFIGFFFVIYILLSSLISVPRSFQWIAPGLLMYILVSGINPYIFSSNGMLLIGFSAVVVTLSLKNRRHIMNKKFFVG